MKKRVISVFAALSMLASGMVPVMAEDTITVGGEVLYSQDFEGDVEAEMLTNDVALFSEDGMGLDSIDSLEMIAAIDKEFGVSMTGVGKEHFYNVDSLTKYVAQNM